LRRTPCRKNAMSEGIEKAREKIREAFE